MADTETFPAREIVAGKDYWQWSDDGGSFLRFRPILRGDVDVSFREGSDYVPGVRGFRVSSSDVGPLLRSLAAWSADRLDETISDAAAYAVEVERELRVRDERIAKLEGAIEDALSSTWSKDQDDGWGTKEDGLYEDSLTALAALVPHWRSWGDQAWTQAGQAEERAQKLQKDIVNLVTALEPIRELLANEYAALEGNPR